VAAEQHETRADQARWTPGWTCLRAGAAIRRPAVNRTAGLVITLLTRRKRERTLHRGRPATERQMESIIA
jgi:hypothetical protein